MRPTANVVRSLTSVKHRIKRVANSGGWTIEHRTDERAFRASLDITHKSLHPLMSRLSASPAEADLVAFVIKNAYLSYARSFDDLFAWWALRKSLNPFFIEAGCWNPTYLNNTYLLEQHLGWPGLLVEPSPKWRDAIERSRSAPLIRSAIVSEVLGTPMVELDDSGESSARAHLKGDHLVVRRTVAVPTLTLRELLDTPQGIDLFLSLDVEGDEHVLVQEILDALPATTALSVEVLNPKDRSHLVGVMATASFSLLTPELSHYNMWFVRVDGLPLEASSSTKSAILGWSSR